MCKERMETKLLVRVEEADNDRWSLYLYVFGLFLTPRRIPTHQGFDHGGMYRVATQEPSASSPKGYSEADNFSNNYPKASRVGRRPRALEMPRPAPRGLIQEPIEDGRGRDNRWRPRSHKGVILYSVNG